MKWYETIAHVLGIDAKDAKKEYGGIPTQKAAKQSRHAGGRCKPAGWREKRRKARKCSDASRKRNRK